MRKISIGDVIRRIALLASVVLLMYPLTADMINNSNLNHTMKEYTVISERYTQEEKDALFAEAKAYNESLLDNKTRWTPSEERLEEYKKTFDPAGTGVIGKVEAASIGLDLPIYHTASESVLQTAAGHMEGSSFPIGEGSEHAVLTGHRGLTTAKLFTNIDKLQEGDEFRISVLDRILIYEIDAVLTVLPEEMEALEIAEGENRATLVTCTPYGVNSHRLLVMGKLKATETIKTAEERSEVVNIEKHKVFPAAELMFAVGALLLLLTAARDIKEIKRRKRKTANERS